MEEVSFRKIVIATDGSENAKRAGKIAIEIARGHDAELIVVNVVPSPANLQVGVSAGSVPVTIMDEYYKQGRAQGERFIGEIITEARASGVKVRGELLDKPYSVVEGITSYARNENIDLIVVGTRGLGSFKRLLIGSVSSGIVSHAHCSVLVVR